ncbi:MAG TPA: hypothetical protein VGQ36_24120 [Thermoanaerobaculia bacterium]|jgi:hypothetical protein|nr:hypothetical protein [Thermoanaerobaculia bacterium]
MPRSLVLPLLVVLASPLLAQEPQERVLLPVGQQGYLANQWGTIIQFYNGGTTPVPYYPYRTFCIPRPPYTCSAPRIQPRQIVAPILLTMPSDLPTPGAFIYFPKDAIDSVHISARVSHFSRTEPAYDGGMQLPAVRSHEFTSDRIVLLRITLQPHLSQTLRIYEDGNRGGLQLRLRFFDDSQTFGERIVTTHRAESSDSPPPYGPIHPGGLQINDLLAAFPELNLAVRYGVNLEITPVEPGMRFWAFLSMTNRSTNEVTLVVPE